VSCWDGILLRKSLVWSLVIFIINTCFSTMLVECVIRLNLR
jgi:hypothetical protein